MGRSVEACLQGAGHCACPDARISNKANSSQAGDGRPEAGGGWHGQNSRFTKHERPATSAERRNMQNEPNFRRFWAGNAGGAGKRTQFRLREIGHVPPYCGGAGQEISRSDQWKGRPGLDTLCDGSAGQSASSRIQMLRYRTGLPWSCNWSGPLSPCGW